MILPLLLYYLFQTEEKFKDFKIVTVDRKCTTSCQNTEAVIQGTGRRVTCCKEDLCNAASSLKLHSIFPTALTLFILSRVFFQTSSYSQKLYAYFLFSCYTFQTWRCLDISKPKVNSTGNTHSISTQNTLIRYLKNSFNYIYIFVPSVLIL